jgi:hypothetical protein
MALEGGYLHNLEEGRGKPHRLAVGDPLPEEQVILPEPGELHGCAVAETPPPEPDEANDVVLDALADFEGTALSALQTSDDENTIDSTADEINPVGCPSHPEGPTSGCRYGQEGKGAAA